jgi:uncharacterized protein YbjT (DUF2867 family)
MRPDSWASALTDIQTMYVLLPDGTAMPEGFMEHAHRAGVRRVVLHSDRNVDTMNVTDLQSAERQVRQSSIDWTIIRPDWFNQDFETFFRRPVIEGHLLVPVGSTKQGFVDADDIAAVAVHTLRRADHVGETLPLTGPRSLAFVEALDLITDFTGRSITFDGTVEGYREALRIDGVPGDAIETRIRNLSAAAAKGDTTPSGVVEAVLQRPAKDFSAYVHDAAERGVWR